MLRNTKDFKGKHFKLKRCFENKVWYKYAKILKVDHRKILGVSFQIYPDLDIEISLNEYLNKREEWEEISKDELLEAWFDLALKFRDAGKSFL